MNLYTISKEDLQEIIQLWGYPKYRADQVYHWIREKGVVDVDQMNNIPKKLRKDLEKFSTSANNNEDSSQLDGEESVAAGCLEVVREQVSPKDGTMKRLYKLRDGKLIEVS